MSSQTTENIFECNICCTNSKESNRFRKVECQCCSYTACSKCQTTYGQLDCMNCHQVFRNSFAIQVLGSTFVTKTVKQNKLRELMLQQREEFKTVGPLVEWTKNMRIIEEQQKYGIDINLSEEDQKKPVRVTVLSSIPCISNTCRGFITTCNENEGKCNLCKTMACMKCHEKTHDGECKAEILETIKEILENTKPCPKCQINIHRTHGCDHMHCTKCNTHFNYNTGTILHNSSNYHYREALIRENREANTEDECRVSDEESRIPEDTLRKKIDDIQMKIAENGECISENSKRQIAILLDGFYNVPKAVRSLVQNEYRLQRIAMSVRDRYDELQVKFAMNEISDKIWEQHVYKTYLKQLVSELISSILYIYLGNVDGFQSEFYNYTYSNIEEYEEFVGGLVTRFDRLIDIANDSISEIRMDYEPTSSNQIMIRKLGESHKCYCVKQKIKKTKTTNQMSTLPNTRPDMQLTQIMSYDYQTRHINKLENILRTTHFAIDLSPLGTGKTYSAGKIFQNNSNYRHLLTISPLSVKTKWAEVNETYGLKIIANLTYNEMGGKRGINPKNGLLTRNDYKVEVFDDATGTSHMLDKYVFTPTEYLLKLIEDGLFVVIDEFQHLKNESAQTEACKTIISAVLNNFNRVQIQNPDNIHESIPVEDVPQTRVLLMSGSPIDQMDQVARLFKTLGIMRNPRIVSGYKYAGINEVIDYLNTKFPGNAYLESTIPRASRYVHGRGYQQNSSTAKHCMYQWFLNVIKPKLTSTMDAREILNSEYKLEKFNGYFQSNNVYLQEKIDNAVKMLETVATQMQSMRVRVRTNMRNPNGMQQEMMRKITLQMIQIETAKIKTFELLARKHLNNVDCPTKKVVIALNYTGSVNELESLLSEYKPLILNGSKTFKQRRQILKAFQSPTCEHRLLIGNFSVMSTGIDLDDKDGGFPRVCLASPNCNTISIYQLGHRFLRGKESKSSSQIYMVYSVSKAERNITEILMRKGGIMKEVLSEQAESGMVFPCDYTEYHETL